MKTLFLFILTTLTTFHISAQGIEFFEGSWEEAKAKATKEHKIIFVDAYATWCGPCKKMARDVFPQEEVGKVYNKHFINVKLDMEKGEGIAFGQKYNVTSYPTLLFIDGQGEVVHIGKGSRAPEDFIKLGQAALNLYDKSDEYAEQYEEGERDPEFLRAYAYALLVGAKPTSKIANEYLKTQEDLTTKQNLEFLFDLTTESDSRIFNLLVEHKEAIIKLKGEQAVYEKFEEACEMTISKAIEFNIEGLLQEAKDAMKKARPDYAKEYTYLADISYYLQKQSFDKLTLTTDKYLKKYAKKDATTLANYASLFGQHVNYTKGLQKAEQWAKSAVDIAPSFKHLTIYASLLKKNGKHDEARKISDMAAPLAPSTTEHNH